MNSTTLPGKESSSACSMSISPLSLFCTMNCARSPTTAHFDAENVGAGLDELVGDVQIVLQIVLGSSRVRNGARVRNRRFHLKNKSHAE